jgi:N-acetylglucosaminyl-diphospho-decaprenol L-rhamnosyltransferase
VVGDVSAVIVNWNGARDLEVALPSLLAQSPPLREIIVVDNGSIDDSKDVVDRHGATWLPLHSNRGIAAALNEGARIADGRYLLFLNQDMHFPREFVKSLSEVLDHDDNVFAVDAQQLDWAGKCVHERTVFARVARRTGDLPGWRFAQEASSELAPCGYVSAANALVRRDRFEEIGGWDAGYPASWEDVDLSIRAWARGWTSVYQPAACCAHRVSATMATTDGRVARVRGTLTGRARLAVKLAPWDTAVLTIAGLVAGALRDVLLGRIALAGMRLQAVARALRELPELLALRRVVTRSAGGPRALWRQLESIHEQDHRVTK